MSEDKNMARESLARKLNAEVEAFVNSREKKPYTDGWSEDNWDAEMQQHPLFMTESVAENTELPPLVEALQQLKYDPNENTAEELASNYKEDGNQNFKIKKYRWAIDSYSAGIKQNCDNKELNAVLYTNRAASHFHLGNYRSSLRDAEEAVKRKPDHLKAILRGAQCCKELNRFPECIIWCEKILKIDPRNEISLKLIEESKTLQKIHERDHRKLLIEEQKKRSKENCLNKALRDRNIKFYVRDKDVDDTTEFDILAQTHPDSGNFKVYLNDNDKLVWPVIFLYPEHAQTDFVQEFLEDSTFQDHLNLMFGETNIPKWDADYFYKPSKIEIYFEDYETKELVKVNPSLTLKNVLSHERFQVSSGNPVFLLVAKDTRYYETFEAKHQILRK